MAELNAPIIAKASGTASEEPLPADLEVAELAVNTADGKLFTKHTDGSVVTISGGGGGAVDSVNGETGVVSLGVQDMDDYELSLDPTQFQPSSDTGRWATVLTSHAESGGTYTFPSSGQWRMYKLDDDIDGAIFQFGSPDSDGESTAFIGALNGASGLMARFEVDGVTYGPITVVSTSFTSGTGVGSIRWDPAEFDPSTTSWGYVFDAAGPPVTTDALEVNLVIGYSDPTLTLPLAEGDILQWNNADQKFKPAQLPVDSVNGETGVVSLGIQEMDDFEFSLSPVPEFSDLQRSGTWSDWMDAHSNPPGYELPTTQGEWRAYEQGTLTGNIQVATLDDDGNSSEDWVNVSLTDLLMLITVDGQTYGPIPVDNIVDGPGYGVLVQWDISDFDPSLYSWGYSLDNPAQAPTSPRPVKPFTVQLGYTIVYPSLPLAEGDILQWVDADQKFNPAQLPDAVATRTLLGIGEYVDDSAAGTGGVTSGAMYYNTTSSDYRLKS